MSNKQKKSNKMSWIVTKFIEIFTAKGVTDFENNGIYHNIVFDNDQTQLLWEGFLEGHKMTIRHQFGQFIIGKHQADGRPVFSEVPFRHSQFNSAFEECKRLRELVPDATFGLYQCVKVMKPVYRQEIEPEDEAAI